MLNRDCEYCGRLDHSPGCPKYESPPAIHICEYCNEGIQQGDYYLSNNDNKYIHKDCAYFAGLDWVIQWLGFNYEQMEECDD